MSVLVVTGTGTGVGKTVATAAIAACATAEVAVVKLAQTGVADGEPGDLAEVTRLSGITDVHELARYPDPLSPHHAARMAGLPPLDLGHAVMRVAELEQDRDLVIVEGAGGLLVPYDDGGWTIDDLALELEADYVLVTASGLGTLNHTKLTLNVLEGQFPHIVIGSWPRQPQIVDRLNAVDLSRECRASLLGGVLPAGLPAMADFAAQARAALGPALGGTFDGDAFRRANTL